MPESARPEVRKDGVGVSAGIAIGRAYLIGRDTLKAPRHHVEPDDVDTEVARLVAKHFADAFYKAAVKAARKRRRGRKTGRGYAFALYRGVAEILFSSYSVRAVGHCYGIDAEPFYFIGFPKSVARQN